MRFIRANAKVFGLIVAGAVVSGVFAMFLQRTPFLRGLFLGIWIAGLVGFLAYLMGVMGFAQRMVGAEAEIWTAKELRKLSPKAWKVVDDVSFYDGNVDHVLVGANSVFAVETKWTTQKLVRNGRPTEMVRKHATSSRRGSERIARLLTSEGTPRDVVPMLVYWGPGASDLPEQRMLVGGVRVVAGIRAGEWLAHLHRSAKTVEFDLPAWDSLQRYLNRSDT